MSEFERPVPTYRLAETHWDDELQTVAARELGDANRWPELVWINSLVHPYITNDERLVGSSVLLAGSFIKVPAPVGVWTDDAESGQVFERDCAMDGRLLSDDGFGDILVMSGADNLRQQLQHRIDTPRGQARRNPEYGCLVHRLKGTVNGPTSALMAAEYVKAAVKADYRVSRVESSVGVVVGDAIQVTARAVAVEGSVVDLVFGSRTPGSPVDPVTPPSSFGWGNNYGNNWGN